MPIFLRGTQNISNNPFGVPIFPRAFQYGSQQRSAQQMSTLPGDILSAGETGDEFCCFGILPASFCLVTYLQ